MMEYKDWLQKLLQIFLSLLLSTRLTSGNGHCTESSLQQTTGEAWVESQRPLSPGWATGVTAVFCSLDPVTVQLWDRDGDTSSNYRLVWSTEVVPPDVGQVYNISFGERMYISARERVGLVTSGSTGHISVMKQFDATFIQLMYSTDKTPFENNREYQFEDVLYPGKFLIDFCSDQGCPSLGLLPLLPEPPNPVSCGHSDLLPSGGKVKLESLRPLVRGVVKAIKVSFCETEPVLVQLWAPDGTSYRLIWQKILSPVGTDGTEKIIVLEESEYIDIKESYRLGLQNVYSDDIISVPSEFYPKGNLVESLHSDRVEMCGAASFGGTAFPSKFLLDFCTDGSCQESTPTDTTTVVDKPCPGMPELSTSSENDENGTKDQQGGLTTSTTENNTSESSVSIAVNIGGSASNANSCEQQWSHLVVIAQVLFFLICQCL